jgi:two-component system, chemotaxis family, chemotaxis protein CheY
MAGRVLVVDDDESIRSVVTAALREEGYEVLEATNGAAALEIVSRHRPVVILLDMWMPVMDGWEFVRHYRSLPGPHAPIVVMTAAVDAKRRGAEIAADGVLAKPFELEALLNTVASYDRNGSP